MSIKCIKFCSRKKRHNYNAVIPEEKLRLMKQDFS